MKDDEISSNHIGYFQGYTILKKSMLEGVHICNMELGSESNNVPDQLEIVGPQERGLFIYDGIVLDAHYFLYED